MIPIGPIERELTSFASPSVTLISGINSRDILPIAQSLFRPTASPDLPTISHLAIFLGANDAVLFGPQRVREFRLDRCRHISPSRPPSLTPSFVHSISRTRSVVPEYTSNLLALLQLLPASTPKLLITPPIPDGPFRCASKGIPGLVPDRSEENTGRYAEAVRELAREMGREGGQVVWAVDLWGVSISCMLGYRRKERRLMDGYVILVRTGDG